MCLREAAIRVVVLDPSEMEMKRRHGTLERADRSTMVDDGLARTPSEVCKKCIISIEAKGFKVLVREIM